MLAPQFFGGRDALRLPPLWLLMTLAAKAVAAALAAAMPTSLEYALRPEKSKGVPARPGFYAWWIEGGTIAGVPHEPHPADPRVGLLYVGISPKRSGSRGVIRSRVIDQHVKGNTASSTFRLALAALLLEELKLVPRATTKKVVLDRDDNSRLRDWQFEHLSLTWCERERPWEIEDDVIALMRPPLNCAANMDHPFYPRITAAREAFRAAGRG